MQRTVQALGAKSNNAENRLRRNNIRVLGLPQGEEGDRPAEEFLKTSWASQAFLLPNVVERAHRPSHPGNNTQPFLVCFHNVHDRDRILSEARQRPTLKYGNASALLFPDFLAELQRGCP